MTYPDFLIFITWKADGIDKDLVFKLQYKTHVYFFRAENEYTFFRYRMLWLYTLEQVGAPCATWRLSSMATLHLAKNVSFPLGKFNDKIRQLCKKIH